MLRQQSSAAEMCGAAAGAAPSCSGDEDGGAGPSDELLQRAQERTGLLSQELTQEISRNEQVPVAPQQADVATATPPGHFESILCSWVRLMRPCHASDDMVDEPW